MFCELHPMILQFLNPIIIVALVYGYIYSIEKSKLFFIWTLSWVFYVLCYVMQLLYLINEVILFEWFGQLFWITSSYLLIFGGSIYINKSIHWIWQLIGLLNLVWLAYALVFDSTFFWLVLPSSIYIGLAYLWLSSVFFQKKNRFIAVLFCIWGIHKLDYPFLKSIECFAAWGYYISQIFAISVAVGVLVEYLKDFKQTTNKIKGRYRTLLDYSDDIIFSFDEDYTFISLNNKLCELLDKKEDEIIGRGMFEFPLFHQIRLDFTRLTHDAEIENRMIRCEKEVVKNETIYNYQIDIAPIKEKSPKIQKQLVCTMHNISELRNKEKTIRNLAYYDQLTGLPNLYFFSEYFQDYVKRKEKKAAFVIVDIFNFRKINDVMGHTFGDTLIKNVANRLRDTCGEYFLFRFNGDKYGLLVDSVESKEMLMTLIEDIFDAFNQPITLNNQSYYVQLALGIDETYMDNLSIETLIMNADTALNKAKELGPNQYYFYNIVLKNIIIEKMEIEKKLRKAIEEKELEIYYQPLVDIRGNHIYKVEALLRWKPHGAKMIMPNEFIPVAESSLLIIDIGYWVIEQVCNQLKEWEREGTNICVAINVSVRQLEQKDFVERVQNILNNTHVLAENIEFEITESIFIDSIDNAVERINKLKDIGFKISLDDFGTHYSSLNYLRKLPCDTLKIDKSFIDDMANIRAVSLIVKTIIDIAHNLDMKVVAEGVDTVEKLHTLTQMDCDVVQGYLFGKPVTKQEIEKVIRK